MEEPPATDPAGAQRPLPYARQWIDESDIAAVSAVLRSDYLTQGPTVGRFEAALCSTTRARYAVAVSSGTAALHLVAQALGLRPGLAGVTSPITFAASANCFLYTGAAARFCDVDPESGLMTPAHLAETLAALRRDGSKPGVVVAVSLAGRVPDLPGLRQVCEDYGWALVEDAAHSLGAIYRMAGASHQSASCDHTRAAILSFHPVKHICTGEGGAVLTNDRELAERVRLLRSHGIRKPDAQNLPEGEGGWYQDQVDLGFHYRLTDIQAALGLSQIQRLPAFLARRRKLAQSYSTFLAGPGFSRLLAAPPHDDDHAWHLYVVRFHDSRLRRQAYDFLRSRGIHTQVHYVPVYRHTHYRRMDAGLSLPNAEDYYSRCLSLPMFPRMSDADLERVVDGLAAFASQV